MESARGVIELDKSMPVTPLITRKPIVRHPFLDTIMPYLINKIWRLTVSNALDKSIKMPTVNLLLSIAENILS